MVIATHPGLDGGVQQAKQTCTGLVPAAAILNLLAIPLGDSLEPCQGALQDRNVIVGGWRRVDQVENYYNKTSLARRSHAAQAG